jgi:hypothetical protein
MTAEEKINQLRELFADAPEVGRTALEKVLSRLASDASQAPPPPVESAGRVGSWLGKVSELTIIVPFAPGRAERLRAFLRLFGGNLAGADDVGTVHDMRFVAVAQQGRCGHQAALGLRLPAHRPDHAAPACRARGRSGRAAPGHREVRHHPRIPVLNQGERDIEL